MINLYRAIADIQDIAEAISERRGELCRESIFDVGVPYKEHQDAVDACNVAVTKLKILAGIDQPKIKKRSCAVG